ncbi:MAG: sensor histidine kinase, partial [Gammaproteobacteria bacterium]
AREAAILYLIDATEQKALEAKFAQSSKMQAVGKLAGGIAHDFNNVLSAIIGFSDLLLQTHRPTDPAYKDIKNIQSSATRAAGLVAKLLAFSRRQPLAPRPINANDLIGGMIELLHRTLGEMIMVETRFDEVATIEVDPHQLENAILNLAVNARDAMGPGGRLSIATGNVRVEAASAIGELEPGDYVRIEVSDTGVGMSAETLSRAVEPFFTTKEVGKGTGLGLSQVYGFAKQSGGDVDVESEVGRGSTFT